MADRESLMETIVYMKQYQIIGSIYEDFGTRSNISGMDK